MCVCVCVCCYVRWISYVDIYIYIYIYIYMSSDSRIMFKKNHFLFIKKVVFRQKSAILSFLPSLK